MREKKIQLKDLSMNKFQYQIIGIPERENIRK